MEKKILITGGAGFVGSSLALAFKKNHPDYLIVAFDNLKRRGSELNLSRLKRSGVEYVHGDIRSKSDFAELSQDFTCIIEASAEPSVLAGLDGSPDYLIDTNLGGTVNCLNFARACKSDFIFLSTSRVYPIDGLESIMFKEEGTRFSISETQMDTGISKHGISEDFGLWGHRSLYGATKLASELLIQEFNSFYGLRTIVNRCGVLAGPWQMGKVDQGFVALWLAQHFWKKPLSYFGYGGTGKQVRDLLHVDDLYQLVDIQLHQVEKFNGETFNVGGGNQVSVSLFELTKLCENITKNQVDIQQVKENRKADIRIYITDNSKVTKFTGWKPLRSTEDIVQDVYFWLEQNQDMLRDIF